MRNTRSKSALRKCCLFSLGDIWHLGSSIDLYCPLDPAHPGSLVSLWETDLCFWLWFLGWGPGQLATCYLSHSGKLFEGHEHCKSIRPCPASSSEGQLVRVFPLLLPFGSQWSNSGGQTWSQAPFSTEPFCWPFFGVLTASVPLVSGFRNLFFSQKLPRVWSTPPKNVEYIS